MICHNYSWFQIFYPPGCSVSCSPPLLSLTNTLSLSLPLFLSLSPPLSLSFSLSRSACLSLSLSFSPCLSLSPPVSLSPSLHLSFLLFLTINSIYFFSGGITGLFKDSSYASSSGSVQWRCKYCVHFWLHASMLSCTIEYHSVLHYDILYRLYDALLLDCVSQCRSCNFIII